MARVRSVSTMRTLRLDDGFTFAETAPGAATTPAELAALGLEHSPAEVPGTVASSLRALGRWSLGAAKDFDEHDYWFRHPLGAWLAERGAGGEPIALVFEGLATVADVFVGDRLVASTESMWIETRVDLQGLAASDELFVRFHALSTHLAKKRPRPRYKTRLVRRQELRAIRTTLLGRMPGWTPQVAPVGPFRPIRVEIGGPRVEASVRTELDGTTGVIDVRLEVTGRVGRATLRSGEAAAELDVTHHGDRSVLEGALALDDVDPWWPHTHGAQPLHEVLVELEIAGATSEVDLGEVGFRSITKDEGPDGRGFGLVVNGEPVFARGAVFTPLDVVSLGATEAALRAALEQVRRAGMNMIRLSGTLIYETHTLFELCDELGILVFHDLMFANMDYPKDEAFVALAEREAREQIGKLDGRACLAIVAGGSEVAQQAAMLGLGHDAWQRDLFEGTLGRAVRAVRPDVLYVPSTPWGGALPFRADVGLAHYYGVGAYERPLDDARRARVRFAAECLAFANVPSRRAVAALLSGGEAPGHHPRWKERVPRDHGAGWDFEDVRDHYVRELFGVDPAAVRYADAERWLALGRAATAEVMARTFAEWRRDASGCRGALVWLLRDLWPGAGFGLVEQSGAPKSCYFALRRVLAPVALLAIDEGLNGLTFVAKNERTSPLSADVEISAYHRSSLVKRVSQAVLVPARGELAIDTEEVAGTFFDPTRAYRFGPPNADLVVAKLVVPGARAPIAEAAYFPLGLPSEIDPELVLEARGARLPDGTIDVHLRATRTATFVGVDVLGYEAHDDGFHMEPGSERVVRLSPVGAAPPSFLSGTVHALNAPSEARVRFDAEGAP